MERQLNDDQVTTPTGQRPVDQERPIDPLRRVFVPRETKTAKGTIVFRTHDDDVYLRLDDGSIRRAHPKVNGKLARRLRARVRKSKS